MLGGEANPLSTYFAADPECYWAGFYKPPRKRYYRWVDDNSIVEPKSQGYKWVLTDKFGYFFPHFLCACIGKVKSLGVRTKKQECNKVGPGFVCMKSR